jgi:arsenate reductase
MNIKFFHNPRCGKSREALQYLKEKGIEPEIVLYLQNTPTFEELKNVICKLSIKPIDLIRKKEIIFIEKYNNAILSDDDWIKVMVENPILIERPLIITENQAVIGKPKENIEKIL